MTGGGIVNAGGYVTEGAQNVQALSTGVSRYRENYTYFYRRYSLGLNPADDFIGQASDAQQPTSGKAAYFHAEDMAIQRQWAIAAGETIVVFVDGDLTFADPDGIGDLVTVAEGGFAAFIVSGNITIGPDVTHLEGVYVADGTLTTQSAGSSADQSFTGEGTFVGWTQVALERGLGDTANETTPAESFIFRPDLVRSIPQQMKRSQIIWQETN